MAAVAGSRYGKYGYSPDNPAEITAPVDLSFFDTYPVG
jgi:hypothetical protein